MAIDLDFDQIGTLQSSHGGLAQSGPNTMTADAAAARRLVT